MSRTIVLTGASRGLGRAMLAGFVQRGHTVHGCGRDERLLDELRERFPSPHRFQRVDVGEDEQVAEWAAEVLRSGAAPDLVINNAALINRNAPLWEVPAVEFAALIRVNVAGAYHVIRHFVPGMLDRGDGVIVNFSSGWGRSASPDVAPYCATKWAIEGMTRALAAELPHGMAAVALNPGVIHTQMLESCFGGHASAYPAPAAWAQRAVPFILELGASDNGASLDVPA